MSTEGSEAKNIRIEMKISEKKTKFSFLDAFCRTTSLRITRKNAVRQLKNHHNIKQLWAQLTEDNILA